MAPDAEPMPVPMLPPLSVTPKPVQNRKLRRGADLPGAALNGRRIHRKKISGANLQHASANHAVFNHVRARKVDLSSSELFGAHLLYSNFTEAQFSCAHMQAVYTFKTRLDRAVMDHVDASGAIFSKGTSLHLAQFDDAILQSATLACSARDASFRNVTASHASFDGADLRGADFAGATLCNTTWRDAILTGTNFSGADLTGARYLSAAQLRGAKGLDTAILPIELAAARNAAPQSTPDHGLGR